MRFLKNRLAKLSLITVQVNPTEVVIIKPPTKVGYEFLL